jgi:DNA-binding transcriptional LysR family regulator
MLDSIRAITVFAKVVECGSFRAGAAALGLSPSVASHHVSALEAQVGTALLYRSTRRLSLTRAGEQLLDRVQPLIAGAEVAIDELAANGAEPTGPLRVSMPTPVAFGPVMPLICEFRDRHPGVDLSILIADGQQDMVGDGVDVAIRMGWHEPGAMPSRFLYTAECVLVSSPTYLAVRDVPTRPGDLADWNWVHHSAGPRAITLRHPIHGAETGGDVPRGVVTDAAIGVLQLVTSGAGVAKLPLAVAQAALDDGSLVRLLPEWTPPRAEVRAFRPASAPRTGLSRRFIDALEIGLARSEPDAIAAE